MNAEEDKTVPSTWIPWIMALAVVIGWSAFVPDHLATDKEKSQDGIGLVHQADDLPAPGVTPHPLAGLLPHVSGCGRVWGAPPVLLGVEVLRELPATGFRREGIQGRAPPSRA
jgi:hypothetical protein